MSNVYIVMPAYNEAANIENTIKEWHPVVSKLGNQSRLLIFDDGSKDATGQIVQQLMSEYKQLELISKANSGHGSTLLYAYNYCINAKVDYIFQTDSDGQTSPNEFWVFWEKREDYDFIIGSRTQRGDGVERVVVSRTLKILIWIVFRTVVNDANTPFRLMKTERLKNLFDLIPPNFFLANAILSMLVVKKKERYLWLPITFKPRQGGVNSINLKKITKIGFKAIGDFILINKNLSKNG